MPKRWRVQYTGGVSAQFSSAASEALQGALRDVSGPSETLKEIEADELKVRGGALVFVRGGVVQCVVAPDSYSFVLFAGEA